jgi:hypothetical protein
MMHPDICRVSPGLHSEIRFKCDACGHVQIAHIGTDGCQVCVMVSLNLIGQVQAAEIHGDRVQVDAMERAAQVVAIPAAPPIPAAGGNQPVKDAELPPAATAVPTPPPPPSGVATHRKKHWWSR